MKKLTICLTLVLLTMTLSITHVHAAVTPLSAPIEVPVPTEVLEAAALVNRLESIQKMDVSNMTRIEKKGLRQEVRAIKSELKSLNNGGVYLSVGAIIIIVLLLILLL